MGESQLDRIRGDLETIREAAGMSLPFGREDVWINLALVPCGVILAVAGLFAPLRSIALGVVLTSPLILTAVIGLRVRFRRSTGRSPIRRRGYTLALATGFLVVSLAGYHLMLGKARGLPPLEVLGVAGSFTGAMLIVLGLASPRRRSCLGGVPLLLYGLVLPFCSPQQVVMASSAMVALVGLLTGLIQAWQLRSEGGHHEPAAH
jgi:hypothetical protein